MIPHINISVIIMNFNVQHFSVQIISAEEAMGVSKWIILLKCYCFEMWPDHI